MSRTGRPPKPTKLRVIEGNPGKRKIVDTGVKAPPQKPRRPEWLTDRAAAEWSYIVPLLDELGLLAKVDRAVLAAYCESVATFQAATEAAASGILVRGRRKGDIVKNPAIQVQRDAAQAIARFSSMLGLSPSDRERLNGSPNAGSPNAVNLDALLG